MQFVIGNETYEIRFEYPIGGSLNQRTTAIIKRPGKDGEVIAEAIVRRYHQDVHNKDIARKAALAKVLRTMNADRDFRTAAWKAYHTRPGGIHQIISQAS